MNPASEELWNTRNKQTASIIPGSGGADHFFGALKRLWDHSATDVSCGEKIRHDRYRFTIPFQTSGFRVLFPLTSGGD